MQLSASKQYAVVAVLVAVVSVCSAALCSMGILLWSRDVALTVDATWRTLPCEIQHVGVKKIRQASCLFPGAIPCVNYKMDDACFLGLRGRGLSSDLTAKMDPSCCNCNKDVFFVEWNLTYTSAESEKSSLVYVCDKYLIRNEPGVGSWTMEKKGIDCNPVIVGNVVNVTCPDCYTENGLTRRSIEHPVSVSNTPAALNNTLRDFRDGSVVCFRNTKNGDIRFALREGETLQAGTYVGQLLPVSCVFLGLAVMVFVFGMKGIYFAFRVW